MSRDHDFAESRFIFLTYPDPQQAENALRVLDGTQFGKANILHVNRFGDIERYANMPVGEGELPTGWRERPYVEKVSHHLGLADFRTIFGAGSAMERAGTST